MKVRNIIIEILKISLPEPYPSEIKNKLILASAGRHIFSDVVGRLDDTFGKGNYPTELLIADSLYHLAIVSKSELGYPYDLYLRTVLVAFFKDNVGTLPQKFVMDILTRFEEEGDVFLSS